jgi:class 3 adenylate cyclase
MRVCPRCGEENPDRARFCLACATPLEEPAPEGRERKLVTVLFADVTGSTALGERLDAERLKDVMTAYFNAVREEIEAEGGTVEKFIGDAVMAAFGVPTAHEDDAPRALRATVRMRRRLGRLNEDLAATHGVTLEVRIGVNTGEVIATSTPTPGEGMVTGDPVNVAARLEQAAEPGQVLVGARTVRSGRGFEFKELPTPLDLKGKTGAVQAFELLGEAGGDVRGAAGLVAPMVGRDRELDLLTALLERVTDERHPHLVTIYGDAGVGKSRLVREFLGVAEASGRAPHVVRGRCLPYGEGVTYWPLAEILKGWAGVLDSDAPDIALAKIRRAGTSTLSDGSEEDVARATALLSFTVGLEDPEFRLVDLSPRSAKAELQTAWRAYFSALALERPVVVVVEDIHWADDALLDLLEHVADRSEGPVLFLCPSRPELTARRPGWGGGRRSFSSVSLEPLSIEDADRLVAHLLEIDDLPLAVRSRILARAEGNPFFIEEIVLQLIDEGRIVRAGPRWRATDHIGDVDIPDTVQGVLAARIDLLRPREKRALQAAAVVGRVFWPEPVGLLLNGEGEELEDLLDTLEERELVHARIGSSMAGQREFIFKHILTRDVAYESLPRRSRGPAHAEIAQWLERTSGDRSAEFVELLAHHYAESHAATTDDPSVPAERIEELRQRAFSHLTSAAVQARGRMALPQSYRYGEHALTLASSPLERAEALEAIGETALAEYDGDRAWETLREAFIQRMEHVPEDGLAIARVAARALETPIRNAGLMLHATPGDDETQPMLEAALARVGDGDSVELVRLLTVRSFWTSRPGRVEPVPEDERTEGVGAAERAVEIAIRLERYDLASAALDGATSVLLETSSYAKLERHIRRRLELVDRLEDPFELIDTYNMAAWWAAGLGDHRACLAFASEDHDRWVADVPGSALAGGLPWRALAKYRLGDWDGALADVDRTFEILAGEPPRPFFSRHLGSAAFIHELRGERDEADRLIEQIPEKVITGFWGKFWVARIRARRGRIDDALATLGVWSVGGSEGLRLEALCDVIAVGGRWEEADGVLAATRAKANETGILTLPPAADSLEGRLALVLGDRDRAVPPLRRSVDRFGQLEMPWEEAVARTDLASALLEQGLTGDARAELDRSLPVLERLRSVDELARAQRIRASS